MRDGQSIERTHTRQGKKDLVGILVVAGAVVYAVGIFLVVWALAG